MYGTTAGKTAHIFKELWKKLTAGKLKKTQGQYCIEYLYSTNNSNYQYGRC